MSRAMLKMAGTTFAVEDTIDEEIVAESVAERKEAPPRPPPPKLFPDGDKPYEGDPPLQGMLFYNMHLKG